tara:strand:+ start:3481 stop:4386 length:906 start_codon:yes stop_codon:yes gene_type:complete
MGNKSKTACLHSIVAAMVGADEKLGPDRNWRPGGPIEKRIEFLQEYFPGCKEDIAELGEKIIKSLASQNHNELNNFLKENGFDPQFRPIGEDELGLVGILDLLVEWVKEGKVVGIIANAQRFPAVKMKKSVDIWRAAGAIEPVVCIDTKQDFKVYMTVCSAPHDSDNVMDIVTFAKDIQDSFPHSEIHPDYEGVVFPMVDVNQVVELPWCCGLETYDEGGTLWTVTSAVQQNKFRMNQFGARAQSATSMMIARCLADERKPEYIVDRPFLLWVSRGDMEFPLFVAHVGYGDWKDPGDITVA